MPSTPQRSNIDVIRPHHTGCGFGLYFGQTLIVGRINTVYPGGEMTTTVHTIDGHRPIEFYLDGERPQVKVNNTSASSRGDYGGYNLHDIEALILVAGDPTASWYRFVRHIPPKVHANAIAACRGVVPFSLLNLGKLDALVVEPHGLLHRLAA